MLPFNRRQFLQSSAALGSLVAFGIPQVARAAQEHVDAPIVDRVVIREITDNQHNIFLKPLERPGLRETLKNSVLPILEHGKSIA